MSDKWWDNVTLGLVAFLIQSETGFVGSLLMGVVLVTVLYPDW